VPYAIFRLRWNFGTGYSWGARERIARPQRVTEVEKTLFWVNRERTGGNTSQAVATGAVRRRTRYRPNLAPRYRPTSPSTGLLAAGDQVPEVLPRGSTVGRYLVLERIGAGAMRVVYAAYDPELDQVFMAMEHRAPEAMKRDNQRGTERSMKAMKSVGWRWALMLLVGALSGCAKKEAAVQSGAGALTSSNGIGQNGLTTNGVWANGVWANGVWANGVWANGVWANGVWANGVWANGVWANGVWANGVWANGVWANGVWANGLTGDAAVPGDALRSNPYLRQLLQYVYSCAMPPATYDTFLDPNNGALTCSPTAPCAFGYECSADNKCVVPLRGAIGIGINTDATSWGESGTCDESCQRWVSACVLARTNAYGVHVEISMRAPAVAPPGHEQQFARIRQALATSPAEVADFALREGAFYGNIFASTPVDPPPAADYSGPATGPVAQTPSLFACAGPGSNIPEITKRFCSSQGDQVVIKVPGMCVPGTCTEQDTDATGAIGDCYTATGGAGDHYSEVVTVYLRQPIAVCGNAVCETGEDSTGCPSDCHPGTWTRNFAPTFGMGFGLVDVTSSNTNFALAEMSAVTPDDGVVVVGNSGNPVFFTGIGLLPASGGNGVIAKYNPDGSIAWAKRFQPVPTPYPSTGNWTLFGGITIAADGKIYLVGSSSIVAGPGISGRTAIWVIPFSPDGVQLPSYSLKLSDHTEDTVTRAVGVDAQGNVVVAVGYCGDVTVPSLTGADITLTTDCSPGGVSGASNQWNGLFVAKIAAPPPGTELASVVWARSLADGTVQPDNSISFLGYAGLNLAVDQATSDIILLTGGSVGTLLKLRGTDGQELWRRGPNGARFSVAALDKSAHAYGSDVYVGGYFGNGHDFGCGGGAGPVTSNGLSPFIQKLSGSDGSCKWVNYATTSCPPLPNGGNTCSTLSDPETTRSQVEAISIGFDPSGNVVLGSFGNPALGGAIDFGAGPFPTYASRNIFLSSYVPDGPSAGHLIWAKHIPTILSSFLLGLDLDSHGRVIVSGSYSGSMQVDDRLLVTDAPERPTDVWAFLASFNAPSSDDVTPPAIGDTTGTPGQSGPPVNTVPKHISTQATGPDGATVFFMPPTSIDDGHAGTSVNCSPRPNTKFAIGTTPVTCTATDPLGNHSSASFTVTVADKLGPVFLPKADVTVQAPNGSGTTVSYAPPTAVDQVDGPLPSSAFSCTRASGSPFPVGRTTVTCQASDHAGNTSTGTFVVEVKGPILGDPCTSAAACATGFCVDGVCCASACGAGNASDCQACSVAAGGSANGTCTAVSAGHVCRPSVAICDAVESCDGSSLACPADAAVPGCGPPVVTVPGDLTVWATSTAGAAVTFTATAKDWHGASLTPTCSNSPGSTFPLGATKVTCTAQDADGQVGSASFTVRVDVQAASAGGFYLQPVNNDGSSIFKLGSTIPVKFKLTGPSASITTLAAILTLAKISNQVTGTFVEAISSGAANAGNAYRYDASTQQYIFNLSTKALTAGTWDLQTDLGDGVPHTVRVSLR